MSIEPDHTIMQTKTLKISYWTATTLFALLLVMDGIVA